MSVKVKVLGLVTREPQLTEDEISERLGINMFDTLEALIDLQKEGKIVGVEI